MKIQFEHFTKIMKVHEKRILMMVVLLTVLLRFFYVYHAYLYEGKTKWADDWEYLYFGEQIAQGIWDSAWPGRLQFMQVGPALPMIIAASIKYFGDPVWPVFIYNILITSLIIWVLFCLGKLVFNRKVGWLLVFWGIFYVDFFRFNCRLLKEPTDYFFLTLTIYFLVKSIKGRQLIINMIISAFSFTWLIHADERYVIYIPIFMFAYLMIKPFNFKDILRYSFSWIIIVIILCTPWMIHNYRLFNEIVIISPRTTAFTSKLWGSNLNYKKYFNEIPKNIRLEQQYYKGMKNGKQYGLFPYTYGPIERYYRAFVNFWQPTYFAPTYIQRGYHFIKWSPRHNLMGLLFYGNFLPFYIWGVFWLMRKKHWFGMFIAFIPIIHGFAHTIMLRPLERYRSPVVFCVVLIGSWVVVELYNKFLISIKNRNESDYAIKEMSVNYE